MKKLLFLTALLFASPVWAESANGAAASQGGSFNLRFNPISLLVGAEVEADFATHPDWTVGPTLSYIHFKTPATLAFGEFESSGYSLGARANWFNEGVFNSGLYASPMIRYASIKVTTSDSSGNSVTATASPLLATAIVGYGWFWDTFNMMLGGGATVPVGNSKVTFTDSTGVQKEIAAAFTGLTLEFMLGWKF